MVFWHPVITPCSILLTGILGQTTRCCTIVIVASALPITRQHRPWRHCSWVPMVKMSPEFLTIEEIASSYDLVSQTQPGKPLCNIQAAYKWTFVYYSRTYWIQFGGLLISKYVSNDKRGAKTLGGSLSLGRIKGSALRINMPAPSFVWYNLLG